MSRVFVNDLTFAGMAAGTPRRRNKHLLPVGATVYPRMHCNNPIRGLHRDIEGKATIIGPAKEPHHYFVIFDGETAAVERGPLGEAELREEVAA